MKLGMELGLRPGHIVLDGNTAPLPKGAQHPPIFRHICCVQTAGWINMPLGEEVGLGPNDIVLDGDPASFPKKRAQTPIFRPMWPKGWMDQDATWSGGRPRPGQHCVRW